jgi:hypothetical protein
LEQLTVIIEDEMNIDNHTSGVQEQVGDGEEALDRANMRLSIEYSSQYNQQPI